MSFNHLIVTCIRSSLHPWIDRAHGQPRPLRVYASLAEINIPDGVRELSDPYFSGRSELCRIAFGPSSCLELFGSGRFDYTTLTGKALPLHLYDRSPPFPSRTD